MSLKRIQLRILDPRICKEFPLPTHATSGSAGVDLSACIDAPLELKPGETHLLKTGISIFIEEAGYAAILVPRSAQARHCHWQPGRNLGF